MRKLLNKIKTKAHEISAKTVIAKENVKFALANNRGESSISQVIVILISVVLGALLLAGLYSLFNEIVLPRLEQAISDMFSYNG